MIYWIYFYTNIYKILTQKSFLIALAQINRDLLELRNFNLSHWDLI